MAPAAPVAPAPSTPTPGAAAVPWLLTIAAGLDSLRPSPALARLRSVVADSLEGLGAPDEAFGGALDAWREGHRAMLATLPDAPPLGPLGAWWVMLLAARARLVECGGGFPRVASAIDQLTQEFEVELRAEALWQITDEALVAWCALQPGEGMYLTDAEARGAMLRSLWCARPWGETDGGELLRDGTDRSAPVFVVEAAVPWSALRSAPKARRVLDARPSTIRRPPITAQRTTPRPASRAR